MNIMTTTQRLVLGLTGTIAISPLALIPAASAQTADDTAASGDPVRVTRDVSTSGTYDTWTITHWHGDNRIGSATFKAYGERLYACDLERDGDTVRAGLELDYGSGSGWVADPNGSADGCGYNNLSTDENVPATLYVCVDGHGCWSWRVHT